MEMYQKRLVNKEDCNGKMCLVINCRGVNVCVSVTHLSYLPD